jgi:DNA transposition AAA+ family ATPase
MSVSVVPTTNSNRIWSAFNELVTGLSDTDVLRIGIVYGDPGRGKTTTAEQIHSQMSATQQVSTYWVRAKPTWTASAMLLDLSRSVGFSPPRRSANDLLDELRQHLQRKPGVFLVDEAHTFTRSEKLVEIIKFLHDTTNCAFLLIGEHKTERIVKSYLSFSSRLNSDAIIEVMEHSLADVAEVVKTRCAFEVTPDVCAAIHKTARTSMRLVVRICRSMTIYAKTNGIKKFGIHDYHSLANSSWRRKLITEKPHLLATVGGSSHG